MSAVMRLRADLGDAYDDAMMLDVIGSETDALELLDQFDLPRYSRRSGRGCGKGAAQTYRGPCQS